MQYRSQIAVIVVNLVVTAVSLTGIYLEPAKPVGGTSIHMIDTNSVNYRATFIMGKSMLRAENERLLRERLKRKFFYI